MTDMESMDRAVEEAYQRCYAWAGTWDEDELPDQQLRADLAALIAAVSAKARAEERERLVTAMVMAGRLVDEASLVLETALLPTDEPARSSEEAEVCLHPLVSRMAAVGGSDHLRGMW